MENIRNIIEKKELESFSVFSSFSSSSKGAEQKKNPILSEHLM